MDGELKVNDLSLSTGDGAGASDEAELRLHVETDSHFLLFDLA